MRPLGPKIVLLLGAFLFLAMAPLCVVADAINGTIEHYKDHDPLGVLIQLPPPVDQVVNSLETISIVSVHGKKLHGIPDNLGPHESLVSHRPPLSRPSSPVLAKGPHPSFTPHTLIKAKRAVETPDQFVPQTALPDITPSSSTLSLGTPDILSRHFGDGLLWPRQLMWDPTLIQKPSSSAVSVSEDRMVKAAPAASSPSKGTARVEKRYVKLSGSQYGGTARPQAFSSSKGGAPHSSTQRAGGALKPYMNRVFPQLPHLHSTRTWSTRTASAAATSKRPHRHGFHNHQLPFRPSPSSSSSPSPSRPSSSRSVPNTKGPAAADAAKKEKGTAGQWVAIGICAFLVLTVFLYLLIRGVAGERKDGRQRRAAANGSRNNNNNGGAGHPLQSLRTSHPASNTANTNAALPDNAKLPSTFINPLGQHPPTPPRASWQWGGLRSVGQVEEDHVDNPYTYPSAPRVEEARNPYTYPSTPQVGEDRNPYTYPSAPKHSPPMYPSLSRAKTTTGATGKVPTTSSGFPLTTLSTPAHSGVSQSSSSASSTTLFDNSNDARVRNMLASRNKKNRESWESWNKKCCQNEKEKDGVEEQKGVEKKKKGASKFVPKWPGFRHEQRSCTV